MDWVFSSSLWARGIGKRFLDANPLVILMQTPGWFSGKSARNTILAGFVDLLVYRTMSHWDFFSHSTISSFLLFGGSKLGGVCFKQECLVLVN